MNKTTNSCWRRTTGRAKQLTPENQKILVDIVAYLRGSSASTYQQELVHRDILDMLQEGEARGRPRRRSSGRTTRPSATRFWRSCPSAA